MLLLPREYSCSRRRSEKEAFDDIFREPVREEMVVVPAVVEEVQAAPLIQQL
jgi:hypothetical protein